MDDFMSYINRANMMTSKEILTSFDWEVKFVKIPSAVYWPGELTFQMRLKEVQLPPDLTVDVNKTELRGYSILTPGLVTNSGQFTLNLQDFEDQSITAFLIDYVYKVNNPLTRQSLRKEDLICDVDFYRLNVSRQPVKVCKLRTCLPTAINQGDEQNTEKTPIQATSITFEAQLYWWETLN